MKQKIQNKKNGQMELTTPVKVILLVVTIVVICSILFALFFSDKIPSLLCSIPFFSNPGCS